MRKLLSRIFFFIYFIKFLQRFLWKIFHKSCISGLFLFLFEFFLRIFLFLLLFLLFLNFVFFERIKHIKDKSNVIYENRHWQSWCKPKSIVWDVCGFVALWLCDRPNHTYNIHIMYIQHTYNTHSIKVALKDSI